jgi:hypothetical protein
VRGERRGRGRASEGGGWAAEGGRRERERERELQRREEATAESGWRREADKACGLRLRVKEGVGMGDFYS